MRAVDTNVLVGLMVRENAAQTAAAEEYIAGGAWVPVLAVAEAAWVLRSVYKADHAGIVRVMEVLLNHRQLVVQDADAVAHALKLLHARPSLHFSDCLMVALARKAGHLPLGTFDKALSRVEGAGKI